MENVRTRLPKPPTPWCSNRLNHLRPPRINILLHRPLHARPRTPLQPRTQRALPRRNSLQPLPLPATQLHNLILESLLCFVPRALDARPTTRLVATADPARDACFRGVAPYVCVDGREESVVGVFEGGRGEDAGELVGELLLVQVAEEEE
jgi:hypothetical protein